MGRSVRRRKHMEFRAFKRYCMYIDEWNDTCNMGYKDIQPKCASRNCPVWRRLPDVPESTGKPGINDFEKTALKNELFKIKQKLKVLASDEK